MDQHFTEYFHEFSEDSPSGNFHRVIALHDENELSWENIKGEVAMLPRGWYELAHLNSADRIEFVHEFWELRLHYQPHLSEFIAQFFSELDDIGIYVTQKLYDDPYEVQLVYSIKGDSGFYRGAPPATSDQIAEMQLQFPEETFPADYLAFLQIHNGFYKTTDVTGLYPSYEMKKNYDLFQQSFAPEEVLYTKNNLPVNPKKLIPFYESFGMPFYQCFWAEWYPEDEMGNVYYSGQLKQVSDIRGERRTGETLAFASFADWLRFYLERVTF